MKRFCIADFFLSAKVGNLFLNEVLRGLLFWFLNWMDNKMKHLEVFSLGYRKYVYFYHLNF